MECFFAFAFLLFIPTLLHAQSAIDGFDPGAQNSIWACAVQPDGKILVGGNIVTLAGASRSRLGRLNPDGSLDTAFANGANDDVRSISVQTNGQILVAGLFTNLAGQARSRLGRLNSDGSLDTTFTNGANGSLEGLVVQPDGKIIVCGWFYTLAGQECPKIGRLNADGSLDTTFTSGDANNGITCLALQPDGKIIVGGNFTILAGQPRNYIGRLNTDGSLDTTFTNGANNEVRSLAVQPDGKIIVGGWFSSLAGQSRSCIGRLNANGSIDNTFTNGADGELYSILVQPDGKILVGGNFSTLAGQHRKFVGRLNADGSLDRTFFVDVSGNGVLTLAMQSDGNIIVGGDFISLAGQPRSNLARLYPNGSLDNGIVNGTDGWVYSIATQPDNVILMGGSFGSLVGQACNNIGRLTRDSVLDTGFVADANNTVLSIAGQPDGKIMTGGAFTSLGGQPHGFLGRLNSDGSPDTAFTGDASRDTIGIALQPDGKILVAGWFTNLAGQVRNYIGRFNTNGVLDMTFTNGADAKIVTLALQSDGGILAGGAFTNLGGEVHSHIGRFNPDGSIDVTFANGADAAVLALAVQADDKILVGGTFSNVSGQARGNLARLNADGSLDAAFTNGANGAIYSLALQTDGKIIVGGAFTALAGQPRNCLGRFNPDGSLDNTFTNGADATVYSLALQADGRILVAGEFMNLAGQVRNHIGRLTTGESAFQELAVNAKGTEATWVRTGSGPEVWRTTFELSTNGTNWVMLGSGTRVTNGWEATGLGIPKDQITYVRARGYATAGFYNGSHSIIESVRTFYLTPPNSAPVFSSTPITNAIEGVLFSYTVKASDSDMNSLAFTCPAIPSWLTLQTNTGYGIIHTIAGSSLPGYSGDGGPAAMAQFNMPVSVLADPAGNILISDYTNHCVRRIDATTGIITTIAGDGAGMYGGDGGSATNAQLFHPDGIALDSAGNLFIADHFNHRIRRVDATNGIITTVVGNGSQASGGDGGPAANAQVNQPSSIAFDSSGNMYIAEYNGHCIRRVDATNGIIVTIAGTGANGYNGDGIPAIGAELASPCGIAVDTNDNILVADTYNYRVRKIDRLTGLISTVAGCGGPGGYNGDNRPATSALLSCIRNVTVEPSGAILIADTDNRRIRRVDPVTSNITTIAGTGIWGHTGDGGFATNANIGAPIGIAVSHAGSVLFSDDTSHIRKIERGALLSGTPSPSDVGIANVTISVSDGRIATQQIFSITVHSPPPPVISNMSAAAITPYSATLNGDLLTISGTNPAGVIIFWGIENGWTNELAWSNSICLGQRGAGLFAAGITGLTAKTTYFYRCFASNAFGTAWAMDTASFATTTNRVPRFSSVPAANATEGVFFSCTLTAADPDMDSLTFTCSNLPSWLVLDTNVGYGVIRTIAGVGPCGYSGDGGPATNAQLDMPIAVIADPAGNILISDENNYRVRKIDTITGIITTIAGTGSFSYGGDGGLATDAQLRCPDGLFTDSAGNLFIADHFNQRIRKVDATNGIITTVAGIGVAGSGGDGGFAVNAQLDEPSGVVLDSGGNMYAIEYVGNRVRRIGKDNGIITTIAGTGVPGYNGDGIPATNAMLYSPCGIAIDANDNILIGDSGNHRIRKIDRISGIITTIAGSGGWGFYGDGGPATSAQLYGPRNIAIEPSGGILIADGQNRRIRRMDPVTSNITTIAGTGISGHTGDGGASSNANIGYAMGITIDCAGNVVLSDGESYIRKIERGAVLSGTPAISDIGTTNVTILVSDGRIVVQQALTITVRSSTDVDGDGMLDTWEIAIFGDTETADASTDWDGDGLLDVLEFQNGSKPKAADTDGDGMSDWAEWIAGTGLSDGNSLFAIEATEVSPIDAKFVLSWVSLTDRVYSVCSKTNLGEHSWFTNLYGLPGNGGQLSYTNADSFGDRYFRIGVGRK